MDELSITDEETRESRPPSPTCSSTDEYPDSDPELPATQLSDESSDESDLRYEQPPLDWNDMDPNQRLIWLREHQLPNQKPSKLILTDVQDLSYRQIDRLKKIKRPKSFHTHSSKNQLESKQAETDSQSPLSTEHPFSTDPLQQTQLPDPYISSTDEYSDSESPSSDIEEPLDWDDMDPAQRHAWLCNHPSPTFIHSKLMNTKTQKLTRTQRSRLERTKKPKLLDIKAPDITNSEPSPTPNYEVPPEQSTLVPSSPPQDSPQKRAYEDEIQIDHPTNKQPRQFSPSQNPSSSLKPQQPPSPPSNDEDFDPPLILTNDGKRQKQQDDTRDNKKQKHQENAILPTITETPLSQLMTLSDPVTTPTDPLVETLVISTPPQIVQQPLITESTTNETTVNYPNQEQTTTRTHGFKHHSLLTTEHVTEPSPL